MTQVPDSGQDAPSAPVNPPPAAVLGTFSRARPMTAGQAAGAGNGTVVKVTGAAVPGPNGPLRAPLSGAECVWYRSYVFQDVKPRGLFVPKLPLQPLNELTASNTPYITTGPRRQLAGTAGDRFGSDRTSVVPFGIGDDAGAVWFDPRATDVDSNVFAINKVVRPTDRPGGDGERKLRPDELHVEWIIPVGTPLLAVGTVTQQGPGASWLVANAEDVVLVSTKPEQQILSRNQAGVDGPHLPFGKRRR